MLCNVCLAAFASARPLRTTPPEHLLVENEDLWDNTYFGDPDWLPHHPTLMSLKASVDLNCLICANRNVWTSRLASQLELDASSSFSFLPQEFHEGSESPEDPNDRMRPVDRARLGIDPEYEQLESGFEVRHQLLFDGGGRGASPLNQMTALWLAPGAENETPGDDPTCSTSLESLETSRFSLPRHWIKDCIENHASCATASIWHPTRLLDSGPLEPTAGGHCQDAITVHLVEPGTTATTIEGPYMTLSYRWGSSKKASLVLNEQTYPTLLTGLELNCLPQAFRDSICVCRGLGIRYLWIDALCIVQDDEADWQREAGQMHKVYSNSFCNISATHGEGSSAPFLKTNILSHYPEQVKINRQTENGNIKASTYYVCDNHGFLDHVVRAPVNQRAWVLQERMLSPRVLHFTDTQMFWDCFAHQACETHPRGIPGFPNSTRYQKCLPSQDNDGSKAVSQDDLESLHGQWVNIVHSYTKCDLTVPTDKLIAISALARRFASHFRDDYVAGMWRRSLESDLLWRLPVAQEPRDQGSPAIYVAPSWSWASTRGAVDMMNWHTEGIHGPKHALDENRFFACVEDVQIDYTSDADHFGVVRGGRLRLHGVLQSVQLQLGGDLLDTSQLSSDEVATLKHTPKRWSSVTERINIEGYDPAGDGDVALDRCLCEEQTRAGMLFCMLILKSDAFDPPQGGRVYLLLELVHDAPKGTFRRIGRVTICTWNIAKVNEELREQLSKRHPDQDEANYPCVEYRDGKHSIWII